LSLRDAVDRAWSAFFGRHAAELRAPGVRIVRDAPALADYRGIYILRLGEGCAIGAPPDLDLAVDDLTPDDVFDRDVARGIVGERAGLVLGPSIHSYADASTFATSQPRGRRLTDADGDAVEALRRTMPEEEWAEGGFGHDDTTVIWGIFEDRALVAAGNMTDFDGTPTDVGLATTPTHRGKGLGRSLASAMVEDALKRFPVVRYRALASNEPSRAVARTLGFVDDGANIAVRLRLDA
jgi:RimJ/RimL family protein N-acetyltransferase